MRICYEHVQALTNFYEYPFMLQTVHRSLRNGVSAVCSIDDATEVERIHIMLTLQLLHASAFETIVLGIQRELNSIFNQSAWHSCADIIRCTIKIVLNFHRNAHPRPNRTHSMVLLSNFPNCDS